jgi:hypothetical protein
MAPSLAVGAVSKANEECDPEPRALSAAPANMIAPPLRAAHAGHTRAHRRLIGASEVQGRCIATVHSQKSRLSHLTSARLCAGSARGPDDSYPRAGASCR